MSLIVTGTVGIDTVYTPHEGHREGILGGSCTYFAAAASFYGPVRIVGAVGDDFPDDLRKTFTRFPGIDTKGLETREGSKTFRWGGKYMENMDTRETLFTELGILEEMPPKVPEVFKDSQFVFLANTHPAVQLEMLANFPNRKLAVADTMDLWIDIARDELTTLLQRVDGLVLNFDEAEQFTGKRNTVAAAKAILDMGGDTGGEMGPKFVVVKKGEHGCIFVHKDGIAALPAYPAEEVVDPTGAGDSFAGGMMGFIAAQAAKGEDGNGDGDGDGENGATSFKTIRNALAHGTVMASFNIESFSLDRLATLTREEVADRYGEFIQMIRLD